MLGTYLRVTSIRTLVSQFITRFKGDCQVVVLGAGYDTLPFQLHVRPDFFKEKDSLGV